MDEQLISVEAKGKGSLEWDSKPGTWYIAVAPNPDAPNEYQLSIY
jgi:hypothetical protein